MIRLMSRAVRSFSLCDGEFVVGIVPISFLAYCIGFCFNL